MEKAILKTLIYADIFDYPLTIFEIHKWLIGRKATLRQVERALGQLNQESRIKNQAGYYFLSGKHRLVAKRQTRQKQSAKYFRKAKLLANILKVVPWIKLVGISGGLAMENAQKMDDIDLFIITAEKRLWITRLISLGLVSLIGQRRKKGEKSYKIAGKLCINILLEEDRLTQNKGDIYLAHEVLQMQVLWQREGIYQKYLEDNEWVFKFLPNWISGQDLRFKILDLRIKTRKSSIVNHKSILDHIENLAKNLQLKIMGQPKGMERIEDGALYFHPNDIRPQILRDYKLRIRNIFLAPLDK